MAKTRAQRKAEKRAREAQQQKQRERSGDGETAEREAESRAQHDTQVGVSGEVAEFEASVDTQSVPPEDQASASAVPGVLPEKPQVETPEPPAPSRADEPPAPAELSRRERRAQERAEKEAAKQEEREKAKRRKEMEARQAAKEPEERQRGVVLGFFASCWAELKKVQWPDRDTLVQASAVTLIFVAVMAAYLGALDAMFNWLVKQVI